MSYFTGLRCRMCGTGFPSRSVVRLRPVSRSARGHVRLRRHPRRRHARGDRRATREPVAVSASCCPSPRRETGFYSGFTPLVKADRLAARLGLSELYVKDDSVNHPTFSYKDRVVSVAATRAVELGFDVFACASTGNLANSVAAHAATARTDLLRVHPRQPRSRQGDGLGDLQAARRGRQGQLRRHQPAVHADCRSARLGLREHQPADVLRRGRQDLRLRDRRAARMATSPRTSSARSPAARCCRASCARSTS